MRALFTLIATAFLLQSVTHAAGDAKKGEELFGKCIACHGEKAEGNKAQKTPRLQGQHEWYLVSSLQKFQNRERKHPPLLPAKLSEQDLADLASYITTIK